MLFLEVSAVNQLAPGIIEILHQLEQVTTLIVTRRKQGSDSERRLTEISVEVSRRASSAVVQSSNCKSPPAANGHKSLRRLAGQLRGYQATCRIRPS